jgi:hypothetical protein
MYKMSANVVIDLNVNTTATGTLNVFSQAQPTITNKVIASVKLNTTLLYSSSASSLIEFQGQGDAIAARLLTAFAVTEPAATTNKTALGSALQTSLTTGNLDASDANPFNTTVATVAKYIDTNYKNYSSFGQLALGSYAHYLFGHVDATAAIDNDTTFVAKMNGTNEGASEANLGAKLAALIFSLNPAQCTAIAKQVIGQDASRAFGVDNDNSAPDGWQRLFFKGGDKIYVSITLNAPTVSVLDAAAQQSEPNSVLFVTPIKYMIEVELTGGAPVI